MIRILVTAAAICLAASPANALPVVAAIGAFIGAVGAAIAAVPIIGQVLIGLAISTGLSYLSKSLSKQKNDIGAPKAGSIGTDIALDIGDDVPRKFLVGTCATEGSLSYMNSHSQFQEIGHAFLVQVIALSDWPIDGLLPDIFVNGRKVTYDTGATHEQPGLSADWGAPIKELTWADPDFGSHDRDYLWIKFYDGTQTSADAYLQAKFPSGPYAIPSTFVGKNVAYAIVTQRFGHKRMKGSPAQVRFAAKGIALYDPRKDSTAGGSGLHRWDNQATWEWSENPMVIAYNILRGLYLDGDWFYGLQGMTAQRLPYASWAAAMNECDAMVAKKHGGTEVQYTCGAEIPTDTPIIDAINALLTSCNGRITESGGVYKPIVGAIGASVFSISDGDLPADKEHTFEPIRSLADTVTGVTATYRAPGKAWERHSLRPKRDADLEAREGGRRLFADVAYDFVYRPSQAQRLMVSELLDAGRWRRHQIPLSPEAYVLEAGDVIDWTSEQNGYTEKLFEVEGISVADDLSITAAIRERDPDDYDWDPDTQEDDVDPIGVTIDDPEIFAVQGFAVSPVFRIGGQGKKRVLLRCIWTPALTPDLIGIWFQCRVKNDNSTLTGSYSNDAGDGVHDISEGILAGTVYEVRAKYRSRSQRETPWTDWYEVSTADVSGLAPGQPTRIGTNPGLGLIELTWTDPTDSDLNRVDIFVSETSNAEAARLHGAALAGQEAYVVTPLESGTSYWFWLESVDYEGYRSGAVGPVSASTLGFPFGKPNAEPPGDVTGIGTNAGFHLVGLNWVNPDDDDLAMIEVWMATVDDQAQAEKVYEIAAPGASAAIGDLDSDTTYWFWVRTIDYWTNAGTFVAAGPVTTLAGVDEVLPDSITQTEIADDSISTPKLQANSVVSAKIAALTIIGDDIAGATITGAKIAGSTVTAGNLAAGSVTTSELAALSVITDKLAANAVTTSKLAVGSVTAAIINVTTLSSLTANVGLLTAGVIRDVSARMTIDLNNARILVTD